jgi:arsenate reductase (thioredoxin)
MIYKEPALLCYLAKMKNILVLCTGNSCRSQMAHGYLQHFGGNNVNVYSAGIETHGVNPKAIAIMKEDSIDISHHTSNNVNEYGAMEFDYVITVCDNAKEACPYFPAKVKVLHRNFPDPAKATRTEQQITNAFRATRDLIKAYCQEFISKEIIS